MVESERDSTRYWVSHGILVPKPAEMSKSPAMLHTIAPRASPLVDDADTVLKLAPDFLGLVEGIHSFYTLKYLLLPRVLS